MLKYVLRRLVIAIPMLLGAMSLIFFAMRILPGDPCVAMMGDQATTAALADCTRNLGLDRPLVVQYVDYMWRSVQFDCARDIRCGSTSVGCSRTRSFSWWRARWWRR
jgi:glutathione transport system permease protein